MPEVDDQERVQRAGVRNPGEAYHQVSPCQEAAGHREQQGKLHLVRPVQRGKRDLEHVGDLYIVQGELGLGGGDEDQLDAGWDVLDEAQIAHRVSVEQERPGLDLFSNGQGVGKKQAGKPQLGGGSGLAGLFHVPVRDEKPASLPASAR